MLRPAPFPTDHRASEETAMTDIPIHLLLLTCSSFMLLGVCLASATAQYLRSQQAPVAVVTARQPASR
jgi:hypothetical protein